jgi:hypothetical protein
MGFFSQPLSQSQRAHQFSSMKASPSNALQEDDIPATSSPSSSSSATAAVAVSTSSSSSSSSSSQTPRAMQRSQSVSQSIMSPASSNSETSVSSEESLLRLFNFLIRSLVELEEASRVPTMSPIDFVRERERERERERPQTL